MECRTEIKPYLLNGIREDLLEQLEMRKWSKNDLSKFSGLSIQEIEDLIGGDGAISERIAATLSITFAKHVFPYKKNYN